VAQVPVGALRLEGHLEWPAECDELRKPAQVRVWVNAFEQANAELEPRPDGLVRRFQVDLRLNQEENNRVELQFPGLKPDRQTPPAFVVLRCKQPLKEQRLHLLLFGVGAQDKGALAESLLGAFHARKVGEGRPEFYEFKHFETPVFKEGLLYTPLLP